MDAKPGRVVVRVEGYVQEYSFVAVPAAGPQVEMNSPVLVETNKLRVWVVLMVVQP